MKKQNEEKIKNHVSEILQILQEENVFDLNILISDNRLVSVFNSTKLPRKKRIDLFSNDWGKTWSDMR